MDNEPTAYMVTEVTPDGNITRNVLLLTRDYDAALKQLRQSRDAIRAYGDDYYYYYPDDLPPEYQIFRLVLVPVE